MAASGGTWVKNDHGKIVGFKPKTGTIKLKKHEATQPGDNAGGSAATGGTEGASGASQSPASGGKATSSQGGAVGSVSSVNVGDTVVGAKGTVLKVTGISGDTIQYHNVTENIPGSVKTATMDSMLKGGHFSIKDDSAPTQKASFKAGDPVDDSLPGVKIGTELYNAGGGTTTVIRTGTNSWGDKTVTLDDSNGITDTQPVYSLKSALEYGSYGLKDSPEDGSVHHALPGVKTGQIIEANGTTFTVGDITSEGKVKLTMANGKEIAANPYTLAQSIDNGSAVVKSAPVAATVPKLSTKQYGLTAGDDLKDEHDNLIGKVISEGPSITSEGKYKSVVAAKGADGAYHLYQGGEHVGSYVTKKDVTAAKKAVQHNQPVPASTASAPAGQPPSAAPPAAGIGPAKLGNVSGKQTGSLIKDANGNDVGRMAMSNSVHGIVGIVAPGGAYHLYKNGEHVASYATMKELVTNKNNVVDGKQTEPSTAPHPGAAAGASGPAPKTPAPSTPPQDTPPSSSPVAGVKLPQSAYQLQGEEQYTKKQGKFAAVYDGVNPAKIVNTATGEVVSSGHTSPAATNKALSTAHTQDLLSDPQVVANFHVSEGYGGQPTLTAKEQHHPPPAWTGPGAPPPGQDIGALPELKGSSHNPHSVTPKLKQDYAQEVANTAPHRAAILSYQGNGYQAMNDTLIAAGGGSISGMPKASAIHSLDKAMGMTRVKEPLTVLQAQGKSHPIYRQIGAMNVGDEYQALNYNSTSTNPNHSWSDNSIHIYYRIPKGTKGIFMNAYHDSKYPSEHEFLLARNTKLRLVGKSVDSQGRITATVEVVGQE